MARGGIHSWRSRWYRRWPVPGHSALPELAPAFGWFLIQRQRLARQAGLAGQGLAQQVVVDGRYPRIPCHRTAKPCLPSFSTTMRAAGSCAKSLRRLRRRGHVVLGLQHQHGSRPARTPWWVWCEAFLSFQWMQGCLATALATMGSAWQKAKPVLTQWSLVLVQQRLVVTYHRVKTESCCSGRKAGVPRNARGGLGLQVRHHALGGSLKAASSGSLGIWISLCRMSAMSASVLFWSSNLWVSIAAFRVAR